MIDSPYTAEQKAALRNRNISWVAQNIERCFDHIMMDVELLIAATPTGEERESITAASILFRAARQKFDLWKGSMNGSRTTDGSYEGSPLS